MAIYVTPDDTFEHVTDRDKKLPEAEQTVWILSPASTQDERKVSFVGSAKSKMGHLESVDYILKRCLKGHRNLLDLHGDDVEFVDAETTMRGMAVYDKASCFEAVLARGRVVEDEDRD